MNPLELVVHRVLWLNGPNIWTYRSCIETLIDIQGFEDAPSNLLPGFYERITALLPGLAEHHCGVGQPGGFLMRLRGGTYAAHILEHIVIELHLMAGLQAGFGKARETSQRGVYKMVFRTPDEFVGKACLEAGIALFDACVHDKAFDLKFALKHIQHVCDDKGIGPSTQHILDAARERRIPFIRLNQKNLVQLGYGCQQQRIWTAETSNTSAIAESIAGDKTLCKSLLSLCGVPVPEGSEVHSADDTWAKAQSIGLPIVVKPTDANHGRGLSLELYKEADIRAAYDLALNEGSGVMVEPFIQGIEHRVLVVNYQVVAVARGELLYVHGDGNSTLAQLVDTQINSDPQRGWEEYCPLDPVDFVTDPTAVMEVRRQDFEPTSIIAQGQAVLVQRNSNASIDVTDDIHPEISRLCGLAARVVGLDVAGVDLLCEDIAKHPSQQSFAVLEVNAGPGLKMHFTPSQGKPRNVGAAIIQSLFGVQGNGRIPIISYFTHPELAGFGPRLATVLRDKGEYVGLACSEGLWVGNRQLSDEPSAHWLAGRNCLTNKNLNTLVMETSQRAILAEGLPFDRCSIAVVLSLGTLVGLEDFDIINAEKLFNVTRTLVDLVLSNGVCVLNADEVALLPLSELCDGQIIWLTQREDNPIVKSHIGRGGMAIVAQGHSMMFWHDKQPTPHRPAIHLPHAPSLQQLALAACGWALQVSHGLLTAELCDLAKNT